jgi:hypothetical protein
MLENILMGVESPMRYSMKRLALKECFKGMQPLGLALALCRALELKVIINADTGEFFLEGWDVDHFINMVTVDYGVKDIEGVDLSLLSTEGV